mgnify:CR=1 FL=1
MSRIGKMPIAVPAGVTVDIAENNKVTVKGPKGTLERVLPAEMDIKMEGNEVIVSRPNDLKKMKSLHGLTRTLIHNMVVGVTDGYEKKLEVNGVGYRAQKQGKKLVLSLGYSHPVEMEDPDSSSISSGFSFFSGCSVSVFSSETVFSICFSFSLAISSSVSFTSISRSSS